MAPVETRTQSSDAPGATPATLERAPSRLRLVLLAVLAVTAAAALLVQPRVVAAVRAEKIETWLLIITPALFSVVTALAAIDAWRAARQRGYFRGRSVVVVAACIAFLGLLLPNTFSEYRARTSPTADAPRLEKLAVHRDPRVRALVMDAAGWRPGSPEESAALLGRGLDDPDPLVVRAAVKAVAHRSREAMDVVEGAEGVARAKEIVRGWAGNVVVESAP